MSEDIISPPLYSSMGADPDFGELVEMFVSELPDRVDGLNDALASEDWESVQRFAHQLKGAFGSYGFDDVTPTAAALEHATKNSESSETIERLLSDLVATCGRCRAGSPE